MLRFLRVCDAAASSAPLPEELQRAAEEALSRTLPRLVSGLQARPPPRLRFSR